MNTDLLTVNRDNRYIQSSFQLTLNEARVLELAHAKVQFGKTPNRRLEFTVEEFSQAFGISQKNAYNQMKEGVDQLYERSAEIIGLLATDSLSKIRLCSRADYIKSKAKIAITLTDEMIDMLTVSETGSYTGYSLLHTKNLRSTHALRLYQLLSQFKNTGWVEHSLEDLKFYFGVQEKYKRWAEFDRRVIRPAVKNINDVSNYDVKYKGLTRTPKTKRIERVRFEFKRKDQLLLEL